MKTMWERSHLFFQVFFQRVSEKLYVPCQTGSHDMGHHYLGDLASSYLEHDHLPATKPLPFRGFQLGRR